MPALKSHHAWRSPTTASAIALPRNRPTPRGWCRWGKIISWLGWLSLSLSSGCAVAVAAPSTLVQDQTVTQASAPAQVQSPLAMVETAANVSSEAARETESPPEAPSVVWLIVMPAVPVVGGAFIYLSRRLLGKANGECRLVTHVPSLESTNVEEPEQDESEPPTAP